MFQRIERPDHQPRADEQDERERHLHDDERATGAVSLLAVARRAAAHAKRRAELRTGVLEDRNRPEEQCRDERDRQRVKKRRHIDRDRIEPRNVRRRKRRQQAQRAVCEGQAEDAASHSEHEALEHQLARNLGAARTERGPNRQLLLSTLGANEQQVRDIRARDEQDDCERAHEDPEHLADVADELVFERPERGREPRFLEHLRVEPGERRVAMHRNRNHPCDIRACLGERNARLQARKRVETEIADKHLRRIEAERQDERELAIEKPKPLRQHADDLARVSVEHNPAAEDAGVAAEPASPVAVGEDQPSARKRANRRWR